jgi:hypothetical protein
MPRIYDSASNPIDFCKRCFPAESTAEKKYGNVAVTGEGPDGRGNCYGYDEDHPPYEDCDYNCEKCGKLLTANDNGY